MTSLKEDIKTTVYVTKYALTSYAKTMGIKMYGGDFYKISMMDTTYIIIEGKNSFRLFLTIGKDVFFSQEDALNNVLSKIETKTKSLQKQLCKLDNIKGDILESKYGDKQ